ncbi:MAG: hypothetical protein GXO55_00755 [Chloroflexi bacterium]|nr:hypothetical protein [Chloroflexota bacterium]
MDTLVNLFSWLITPWLPLALLVGMGILLLPWRVRHIPHFTRGGVLLATGIVWFWVVAFGFSPIPLVHTLTLRGPLDMSITLLLRLDKGHWLFTFLAATAAFAGSFLLPPRLPAGRTPGPSTALFLLAGTLLTTMAGNLLTLLLGWAITNAAYLGVLLSGGARATWRTVGLVLLSGILLWAVLAAAPPAMAIRPWDETRFPAWALAFMGGSVWLYLGAYPFHRQHRLAAPGIPAPWLWLDVMAGASWAWRWATLEGASQVWHHPAWIALALFAAFGSALASWLSESPRARLIWALIQRAGLLLLIPLLPEAWIYPSMIALSAAIVLAGGALLILHTRHLAYGQNVAYLLALALFWGLPWTAGAPVRALIATLWEQAPGLGLLLLISDALVLGSILSPPKWSGIARRREIIRVTLYVLPAILVGYRMSEGISLPPATWLWTVGIPLVLGGLLAWQRPRVFVDMRNWAWGMRVMAHLQPWETGVREVIHWSLLALGGMTTLIEGAGWAAWLLFAAFIYILLH